MTEGCCGCDGEFRLLCVWGEREGGKEGEGEGSRECGEREREKEREGWIINPMKGLKNI